jgi:hypothetical protein
MQNRLKLFYYKKLPNTLKKIFLHYWQSSVWHKIVVILVGIAILFTGIMYGVARWYIAQNDHKPLVMGVTFIPAYAEALGLNPEETLDALINDAGARNFRLVSYWNQLEPNPGAYDFSVLDWQFKKIEAAGGTVSLSLGLRQPRWPECHMPDWAKGQSTDQWQPKLEGFMAAVVNRYRSSSALVSYQVENEFFNRFGDCHDFSRDRLVREFNLVKKADPKHPVIISRSNNFAGFATGEPTPDVYGFSVYRRVWEAAASKRYFQYPLPSWHYAFLAGMQKILKGKDSMLHELQTEAWPPNGKNIPEISLEEQNKSFDAKRFRATVDFAKQIGFREIYLWGGEYWYYRLHKLHDASVWNVAKDVFRATN